MSTPNNPTAVIILGKEYRINCDPQEEEALLQAARLLDTRMKEIRSAGKVIGTDRIAVMAALNLAHEVLSSQTQEDSQASTATKRVRNLRERIEVALNDSAQLEL